MNRYYTFGVTAEDALEELRSNNSPVVPMESIQDLIEDSGYEEETYTIYEVKLIPVKKVKMITETKFVEQKSKKFKEVKK